MMCPAPSMILCHVSSVAKVLSSVMFSQFIHPSAEVLSISSRVWANAGMIRARRYSYTNCVCYQLHDVNVSIQINV